MSVGLDVIRTILAAAVDSGGMVIKEEKIPNDIHEIERFFADVQDALMTGGSAVRISLEGHEAHFLAVTDINQGSADRVIPKALSPALKNDQLIL